MSGRPTAEIVADLQLDGSSVEWWLKDVRREAADRLVELEAEVAKLVDDIGPGITGAELRRRYSSTPSIGQLVEYWDAGHGD